MNTSDRINEIYKLLYKEYGSQGWWPGESQLECILGAILTQNTSWSNVEKAIDNLKSYNLISIEQLKLITTDELAKLIRSSGYYNQKALVINNFINFVSETYHGDLEEMFQDETAELRNKLLKIKGIGPETADCILLYGGNKPVFVIDSYTYRILSRHRIVPDQTSYIEMQEMITDSLKEDPELYNEYHALIVKVGKEHCKKNHPICTGCPLENDPHTV